MVNVKYICILHIQNTQTHIHIQADYHSAMGCKGNLPG